MLLNEYQRLETELLTHFKLGGVDLGVKTRRHPVLRVLSNHTFVMFLFLFFLALYNIFFEENEMTTTFKLIWGGAPLAQGVVRGANCFYHDNEMQEFLEWFADFYKPLENEEFQGVFKQVLKKQNNFVRLIMRLIPRLQLVTLIIFILYPVLTWTKTFPLPLAIAGVPPSEISWPLFVGIYLVFSFYSSKLAFIFIGSDCFFFITSSMLESRFVTIKKVMQLLNYKGERNREKDREIMKFCYLMHMDVAE